jgi:hypothetical protein
MAAALVALVAGLLLGVAAPAHAAYQTVDDDIIDGRTAQAEWTGNWSIGSSSGGLVRWYNDGGIGGVYRGELKANTIVRARPGTNPFCIAARVRWQTITASPSFSIPPSASLAVGIQTTSSGWTVSCRAVNSTRVAAPINASGVNHSSRTLLRVHADVCHMATRTSMWVCATDTNENGGR